MGRPFLGRQALPSDLNEQAPDCHDDQLVFLLSALKAVLCSARASIVDVAHHADGEDDRMNKDIGLSLLRVGFGSALAAHGYPKRFGGADKDRRCPPFVVKALGRNYRQGRCSD